MIMELKGEVMERLTNEEFIRFCMDNSELRIERNAEGEILINMPTYSKTGEINSEVNYQLVSWNKKHKLGKTFDSSTGFDLPSSAMRSPDASWVSAERWNSLNEEEKGQFAQICPDFVIEIKSETDFLPQLKEKMLKDWIGNGCRLGWLIVPESETVFIYREDGTIGKVVGFDNKLSGEDVLQNFELELSELRIN